MRKTGEVHAPLEKGKDTRRKKKKKKKNGDVDFSSSFYFYYYYFFFAKFLLLPLLLPIKASPCLPTAAPFPTQGVFPVSHQDRFLDSFFNPGFEG